MVQQGLRQERQRLLQALAVRRQRQADKVVIQPARVVLLQQRNGPLRIAQRQQDRRRFPIDRGLADLRISVLRKQQAAALQQLQRAVQKRLFLRLRAEHGVQQRAAIDDVKGIRDFFRAFSASAKPARSFSSRQRRSRSTVACRRLSFIS